ncbi:class I SAM-dependent methyltransferase [Nocardioides albidus]|uniref:Class I SAM-dependent methyltransferase n=1 Tax=Nocardioides albidus TaxID=1517589 RepID=A0A5C4W3B9_9ACTN|nr:class I SAM-dependent methyltransferase [Nocardioides albidus]TNM42767.1 class I SAM-dependent methyltransferase [Nocardioides albidus]
MSEELDRDRGSATAGADYAERLRRKENAAWKRALDVQRPYRWNLRRLDLGRTLDVGCGIGRNLRNLGGDSVGVDHNADSIAVAREAGLTAYTTTEFWETGLGAPGSYDSLLLAHVLEHVSSEVADSIVREYLPCLRPGGKVVFITPQEVGFRSDHTHIRWVDKAGLLEHAEALGLSVQRSYSFPFPRPLGKVFKYNEFVQLATWPGPASDN